MPTPTRFGAAPKFRLVQVFNGSGQLVKTLCNGIYAAGKHSVSFDSEWLPNGIYYCRLQNGALQQIKPLVKTQ